MVGKWGKRDSGDLFVSVRGWGEELKKGSAADADLDLCESACFDRRLKWFFVLLDSAQNATIAAPTGSSFLT